MAPLQLGLQPAVVRLGQEALRAAGPLRIDGRGRHSSQVLPFFQGGRQSFDLLVALLQANRDGSEGRSISGHFFFLFFSSLLRGKQSRSDLQLLSVEPLQTVLEIVDLVFVSLLKKLLLRFQVLSVGQN